MSIQELSIDFEAEPWLPSFSVGSIMMLFSSFSSQLKEKENVFLGFKSEGEYRTIYNTTRPFPVLAL